MVSEKTAKDYLATIGIECHVQLNTATKLFAAVGNNAREAEPNTLISHICLGMPGALPVLNQRAIELAAKAAFALNTKPQAFSKFDRKHYFYPDLPKGYQITQYEEPIIIGGHVDLTINGKPLKIGITRAHLEEDAGKTTHPGGKDYSLVDLNRAGTPLLEIVSEPDMHSAVEAKTYARELWLLMRYAGVSDADLYHGNMRFDVNVSVSKDPKKLGTRSETKNLNSFKSVEKAVNYEIDRQIGLLEKNQTVKQETRGWDEAKQKTFSQRSKEDAHDYRYFPDPDIPPVELTPDFIKKISSSLTIMPGELRQRLKHLELDPMAIETLLDEMPAGQLVMELLDEKVDNKLIKKIANWLVSDVQALTTSGSASWGNLQLKPDDLINLAQMTLDNQISSSGAKAILEEVVLNGANPRTIAQEKNLLQVSDENELTKIVKQIIANNPRAVSDIKNGETKAIGFLVGQVMKASGGQANPGVVSQLIKKELK